jgi:hypothetical protein
MKHTPGPWTVSSLDGRTIGFTDDRIEPGYQSNFHAICYVRERLGETEGNIALIEAAPQLWEACVTARDVLESLAESDEEAEDLFMPALNLLRSALKKAEPQS